MEAQEQTQERSEVEVSGKAGGAQGLRSTVLYAWHAAVRAAAPVFPSERARKDFVRFTAILVIASTPLFAMSLFTVQGHFVRIARIVAMGIMAIVIAALVAIARNLENRRVLAIALHVAALLLTAEAILVLIRAK